MNIALTQAEAELIMRESSGRPTAKNPNSSARGLWQGLDGIRAKYCGMVGVDPNTVVPEEQVACMRVYIQHRYGTADKALAFWQENRWY